MNREVHIENGYIYVSYPRKGGLAKADAWEHLLAHPPPQVKRPTDPNLSRKWNPWRKRHGYNNQRGWTWIAKLAAPEPTNQLFLSLLSHTAEV